MVKNEELYSGIIALIKVTPETGLRGLEGSGRLRLPYF
jgi:hypothetical protein